MPVSRLTPRFTGPGSGKDGFDDIAVNVGESEVAARVPEKSGGSFSEGFHAGRHPGRAASNRVSIAQ